MSESTQRTQRPSWRRTSWIAILSLITFTVLKAALQRVPQLPDWQRGIVTPPRLTEREADRRMREALRGALPVARVAAPSDFTARVMARVAEEVPAMQPAFQPAGLASVTAPSSSLRHRVRVVGGTVGFSALVVLTSSFFAALANPSMAFSVVGALVSFGMVLLAAMRLLASAAGGLSANGLLVTVLLLGLLTFLLLSWMRLSSEIRHLLAGA